MAWEVSQVVERKENERLLRENEARSHALRQERVEIYQENAEEVRERIPDFDTKLQAAKDVYVADSVAQEIMQSDRPALLAYHLATNPHLVRDLNAMQGTELARAMGRIEARVHLPKPRTETKAPAPPKQVQGQASPTTDYHNPNISMEDYVRLRKEESKRAGGRI